MWPFTRKKNAKNRLNAAAGQSVFERMVSIGRANMNAALDEAEDPIKMASQYVRDFEATVAEAKQETANVIGSVRSLEARRLETEREQKTWISRAEQASNRADLLRAKGDAAGADKHDQLALKALQKKNTMVQRLDELDPRIADGNAKAEQLKNAMQIVSDQLEVVRARRDDIAARSHAADAQDSVVTAIESLNTSDPTSDMSRLESSVTRRESQAQGRLEVAAASTEFQYAELDRNGSADDATFELAELKQKNQAQITEGR